MGCGDNLHRPIIFYYVSLLPCQNYTPLNTHTEMAMTPHSGTLAWQIPCTEEPGGLQSMGVWESDTTEQLHFHFSLSCIGEGNGNPLQCSCLENPRDRRAWWAAIYGVTESRTRLKQLSSNSSSQHSHIYIHKKILILSGDPRSSFYLQPSFPSLLLGMCFWRFPGEQPQLPPLNSIGCCWMGKFLGSKHSRLSF